VIAPGSAFAEARQIFAVDLKGVACNQGLGPAATTVHVAVSDPDNAPGQLKVRITFVLASGVQISGPLTMGYNGKDFSATLGPITDTVKSFYQNSVEADVTAADPAGNQAAAVHFYRLTIFVNCLRG
jgi:hypothetical protein